LPKKRVRLLCKNNEKVKRHFEEITGVKLRVNDNEVSFEVEDPLKAYNLKQVLFAFGRGFDMDDALDLMDEAYGMDVIEITNYTGKSKSRLITMRGRIIGSEGKAKRTIENLTNTRIAVEGKTVCIIGKWNDIRKARKAIEMLLEGAMHKTVYRWLETNR